MSFAKTAGSACAAVGTDAAFPSQPWEGRTARFTAHRGSSAAVVAVHGELDASNAGQLAEYVQRCAVYCNWLVLDLSDLDFIGTAGFDALHTINSRCASADVPWVAVPSSAVSKLLRICDPGKALPVTDSVPATPAENDEPRRLLQLVTQPR